MRPHYRVSVMTIFRDLDMFAINALNSKRGEESQYQCVVNDATITVTFTKLKTGAVLRLTDGVNDVSVDIEYVSHQGSIMSAINTAFVNLFLTAEFNSLGVFFVRSATHVIAKCGPYSSDKLPESASERDCLYSLAVDITERLP
nr:MAG TPA: hypothetical protein [Caudoviricetes sp.]